ncbi:MAG: DUF4231 domain-containing protein [Burkholderiales bacterium]|nr:DUF4231 domain-containing protein [Burkholderiales bacterium]
MAERPEGNQPAAPAVIAGTAGASSRAWLLVSVVVLGALIAGAWWFLQDRDTWPRGEALGAAMTPLIEGRNPDQSLVARVIWDNYLEARANAARWSGLYWGMTFAAAVLSALAALVLKLETLIRNEGAKKDLAALLSVSAALLITVSTSGDFQRKWQANRIAAAELERTGYEFLEKDGADARSYLAGVGQTLLRRHMSIVGGSEPRKPPQEAGKAASQSK